MIQWTLISFTWKARRARGKETTRARKSPKAKEKANTLKNERVLGKASRVKKRSEGCAETVARRDTNGANAKRKAAEPRNKRTVSVRQRKLVT